MSQASGPAPAGIVKELGRAKVNLTLRVLGRRPDGYHELESLIAFADVADEVRLTIGAAPVVTLEGAFASAVSGENIVQRALSSLSEAEPRLRLGSVAIEKNLPVAAGLGGGSADAAAVLRAIKRANPELADIVDWQTIAASLGADVPVCFADVPCLVWGIGERLIPLVNMPRIPAVLVNSGEAVPQDKTGEVFRRLRAGPLSAHAGPPAGPLDFGIEELVAYLRAHENDLAASAREVMPACAAVEGALEACAGVRLVRMSGAGPTYYGIFATLQEARSAARSIAASHPDWWVRAVMLG